jgi:RNA polymerase sigma-54 factor
MKQIQRQQLQQKFSPQQIQLMRLLQLPVTDLEQAIKEEIEKNPLLEAAPPENEESFDVIDTAGNNSSDWDSDEEDFGYDYREHLDSDPNVERREFVLSDSPSFTERLNDQLISRRLSDRQRLIANELIGSLDESGYLSRDLDLITNDMAFRQGIEVSGEEVLDVLHIIQSLDPPGIGARNLRECLLLQLERNPKHSEVATAIVRDHFDDFANHRYGHICSSLGISQEEFDEASSIIRRLNPKPGSSESGSELVAATITPDIVLQQHDGELHFYLNDGNLPRLSLNTYYTDMLAEMEKQKKSSSSPSERETIQFLRTKQANAQSFIDLLQQRHETIVRVMRYIVKHQRRFLLTGDPDLMQPLRQREIAEATGLDISTISRMANSKYLQTDFGTIPLKDCFSKGMSNEAGEEVSVETIKQRLSDAIANEDKHAPLSDDALTKMLNSQGFPLARRTVAKYREQLGLPVARLRRLMILLMLLLVGIGKSEAQMSYYDSLIAVRLKKAEKNQVMQEERKSPERVSPPPTTIQRQQNSKNLSQPTADASPEAGPLEKPMVPLWYTGFPHNRVNPMGRTRIDMIPDEIILKLASDSSDFCFPVKRPKTSNYGWRWQRGHHGVDIGLSVGEPIHCAFDGIVRVATRMGGYGNCIVVRHPNGLETLYGHLSKINVQPNQQVSAGEVIGLGGNTGNSTGPHLHFECRFLYQTFDPEWILDFSSYTLRTRRLHLDKSYFGIHQPRKGQSVDYKADNSIIKESKKRKKRNESTAPAFDIKDF